MMKEERDGVLANPKKQAHARREEKVREEQWTRDMRETLEEPHGRRTLSLVLAVSGLLEEGAPLVDPSRTLGIYALAQKIVSMMAEASPQRAGEVIAEAIRRSQGALIDEE